MTKSAERPLGTNSQANLVSCQNINLSLLVRRALSMPLRAGYRRFAPRFNLSIAHSLNLSIQTASFPHPKPETRNPKPFSPQRLPLSVVLVLLAFAAASETFVIAPKRVPVGPNPSAIAAADLTGDALSDIVTTDSGVMTDPREERPANDEVSLLVAGKDLAFERQPPLRTDFAPYCLVIANMDAMKALDIVVASFHPVRKRHLTVFCNLGNSLFEPEFFSVPDTGLTYTQQFDDDHEPVFTKPGITSVVVRDFNRDGYRDVVATGWSSDVLIYFPGDPTTLLGESRLMPAAGGPRDVKAADFDKDGNEDLVVTMYNAGQIALWKGDGAGRFEPVTRFRSRCDVPHKLQVADVNRDDKPDLVVSHCYADDSIAVYYGDGGFEFSTSQEIVLGAGRLVIEHEIRDVLVADFNQDGKPDIAAACYASRTVTALINTSEDSTLPQTFGRETYTFKDGRPRALCMADFNQDGAPDLAVALWEANAVALLLGKPAKPAK